MSELLFYCWDKVVVLPMEFIKDCVSLGLTAQKVRVHDARMEAAGSRQLKHWELTNATTSRRQRTKRRHNALEILITPANDSPDPKRPELLIFRQQLHQLKTKYSDVRGYWGPSYSNQNNNYIHDITNVKVIEFILLITVLAVINIRWSRMIWPSQTHFHISVNAERINQC